MSYEAFAAVPAAHLASVAVGALIGLATALSHAAAGDARPRGEGVIAGLDARGRAASAAEPGVGL